MTYDSEHDCFVGAYPMPAAIKAYVRYIGPDRFIYVNADLSPEAQRAAYEHELLHIDRDDLNDDNPVNIIEGTVRQLVMEGHTETVPEVDAHLSQKEMREKILSSNRDLFFNFRGYDAPVLYDMEMVSIAIRDIRRNR